MTEPSSTLNGSPSLGELLKRHLQTCSECSNVVTGKPVGIGQPSPFCFEYREIIRKWADSEGAVNNIVAQDEYGNIAPRQADPRKEPIRP
jgi:hypothetical protein